ncbi:hypothetical protein GNE00_09270 [Pseudomonas sp. JL972]|uniref:hypothetical protein n=1 Tax=Stutzerimonas degradans TaxID=2968968 RepID=UPI0012D8948D|nr:hypothetical protein [Stutzerimonas degradans]MTZ13927.1 hypothetical protein [Stutzerimonas degradans]
MSAFSEIYDFGQEWRDTENFQVMPTGNYLFSAKITYKSASRGTERADCTVQIIRNGIQDGEINIYANGNLQPDTHHLGFSEKWQRYQFDNNDGALVISGNSPKMGGKYSVRISPNGLEPSFL